MAEGSPPLTTGDVAKALNVSEWTVINWTRQDLLYATRTVGRHRRYPPEVVEELRQVLDMPDEQERAAKLEELRARNRKRREG